MKIVRLKTQQGESILQANYANKAKFKQALKELTKMKSKYQKYKDSIKVTYTSAQNKVNALEGELEGKESELVALQEKINELKKKKTTGAGGSSGNNPSNDSDSSNLDNYAKFIRRREKERQKRIKTPGSTITGNSKSLSSSYCILDSKKFIGEKPSKYKGQRTRIQAKLRVTFTNASDDAQLDYIQSRTNGIAFDIISNFYGPDADNESIFLTIADLQKEFDTNFLDVNKRQIYVTEYSRLQ